MFYAVYAIGRYALLLLNSDTQRSFHFFETNTVIQTKLGHDELTRPQLDSEHEEKNQALIANCSTLSKSFLEILLHFSFTSSQRIDWH